MRQTPIRIISQVRPRQFWRHIDIISDAEQCWIWQKTTDKRGYGRYNPRRGLRIFAHRIAWSLHHNQEIPDGLKVLHRCDVPGCCNPYHLSLGTSAENSADMVAKDRQHRGERNNHAVLVAEDILAIRASRETQVALAKRYGVWQSTISAILRRKTWKHI